MNNQTKFTAVKNNEIIATADTEKMAWRLIGAKNAADRLVLKNLGFNVVEKIMSVEGVDLSQIEETV